MHFVIVVQELELMMTRGQRFAKENAVNKANAPSDIDPEKIERFITLSKKATEILDFVKDAFTHRRTGMRAVTSKGSVLDTIDYKEEFYNPV